MDEICTYGSLDRVVKEKLSSLIESAFQKVLVSDYFEEPLEKVIILGDYKAAAILKPFGDWHYLDKFAVQKEFQGNGIGKQLLNHLVEHYSPLFWRAKKDNPFNKNYQLVAPSVECGKWFVYSVGMSPSPDILQYAMTKRETLKNIS